MTSSSNNTIAIVGATGNQGYAVAKAFLNQPGWTVRALTRNTSSQTAQELASAGAELAQADLTDPDSLARAFSGASTVFLNTDFWIPYNAAIKAGETHERCTELGFETEFLHAKNAVDAVAATPSVTRLVYSALGPMKEASGGKYSHSGHWDSKAAVVRYIEDEVPQLVGKTQFVYPAAYSTNTFLLPQKYDKLDGGKEWTLLLPGPETSVIPVIHIAETFGLLTRALILGEEAGTKLFAYDCDVTGRQAIDTWSRVTGQSARYHREDLDGMQRITGLPFEVLDGPGFLSEYHFMHGVGGRVVEPKDLKIQVPQKSFEEILRERGVEDIMASEHPEF